MEHKMNRPKMLIILHQALTRYVSVTLLLNMDNGYKYKRRTEQWKLSTEMAEKAATKDGSS